MKQQKKWIKGLAALVVLCLLAVVVRYVVKAASFHAEKLTAPEVAPLAAHTGEISRESGEIVVAENDAYVLRLQTKSLNLIVEDKKNGTVFQTVPKTAKTSADKALLSITFLGEDKTTKEWDSYQYCVEKESYELYAIENGVQMVMTFSEGESSKFYEYMPVKMSAERYEFFTEGLERLVEEGTLEKAKATKYKNTLSLIYAKSKKDEVYNVNYVGQPPASAAVQLIELAKLVGYTTEMLLADADEMGFTVTFEEPAVFTLTLEATLNEDGFSVRIPTTEIVSGNEFYTIQNIKVLPNFGMFDVTEVEEGYFFVPDGAGALMKMNTYNAKIPDYVRPIYDNKYFSEYYFKDTFYEDLMMPVFGMLYESGSYTPHGFLGIVETGADTAYINAKLGTAESGGSSANKIYSSFDAMQYASVKVFGAYSDNATSYLVDTGVMEVDYTVRYLLFPEEVSYFDLAKAYRSYLLKQAGLTEQYPDTRGLYLSVVGTVTLEERILGIPYEKNYSMTTYEELSEIAADLGSGITAIQYLGSFDGGMNNKVMTQAKLVKENGSQKELAALKEQLQSQNTDFFLEADLLKVYRSGNGFLSKLHALHDFSGSVAKVYDYSSVLGIFKENSNSYQLLHPKYLNNVTERFLNHLEADTNLYVEDLASLYYADYREKGGVTPYAAQAAATESLEALAQGRLVALNNPRADRFVYADYAVDIARESSEYMTFYASIPFKQLVMNGMTAYTTENVNMTSEDSRYFLLQAVELAALPKFTLCAKNVDLLYNTKYSYLYSMQYEVWEETIKAMQTELLEAGAQIGSTEIKNHTMLAEQVFLTEYASGVRVITNYNKVPVEVDGIVIDALDYRILTQ